MRFSLRSLILWLLYFSSSSSVHLPRRRFGLYPDVTLNKLFTCYDMCIDYCVLFQNDDMEPKKGRREFSIHNRTKKFASSRRRGKLTKHLVCLGEEGGEMAFCVRQHDGRYSNCLPPDLRTSRKIKDLIDVSVLVFQSRCIPGLWSLSVHHCKVPVVYFIYRKLADNIYFIN